MKLFKQAVLNSLPLGGSSRAAEHEERVLDLFRNRVELKKAYSTLQGELQNCRDRLKQQEGTLARAQETMEALEARLSRPETGAPTLVYYQLRAFWNFAQQQLTGFVDAQRVQQEAMEREQFRRGVELEKVRRMAVVDAALNLASNATASAREAVQDINRQIQAANAWWQFFRRRGLRQRLLPAMRKAVQADSEFNQAVTEREAAAAVEDPEFPGLSVAARRLVNCASICFAHVLIARIADSPAYEAAGKAARLREVPDRDYGDFNACRQMMKEIQRVRALLEPQESLQQELRALQALINPRFEFPGADSCLPDAKTLVGGAVLPGSRVLKDNTWQIARLLMR